jgi:CrcB protein
VLLFVIAGGGALGALARYGLWGWVQGHTGLTFPWGTLVVNLLGSLLIGLTMRLLEGFALAPEVRTFAIVGLLGSFTTFSTYSYETVALLREGDWRRAAFYALGSVVLGVCAVGLGLVGGDLLLRARG